MILLQGVWFLIGVCLQCNISKSHFHSGVMFGQRVVTPDISFRLYEANLVRSRNIMIRIILEKSMENGGISDGPLCKGVTLGVYTPNSVLCSIYSNGNGFFL